MIILQSLLVILGIFFLLYSFGQNLSNTVAEVASDNVAAKIILRDTPQILSHVFAPLDHLAAGRNLPAQFGKPPRQHPDRLFLAVKDLLGVFLIGNVREHRLVVFRDTFEDIFHVVPLAQQLEPHKSIGSDLFDLRVLAALTDDENNFGLIMFKTKSPLQAYAGEDS